MGKPEPNVLLMFFPEYLYFQFILIPSPNIYSYYSSSNFYCISYDDAHDSYGTG